MNARIITISDSTYFVCFFLLAETLQSGRIHSILVFKQKINIMIAKET